MTRRFGVARLFSCDVGYWRLVRPSYVLLKILDAMVEGAMNGYHCYILTKEGRISRREDIECATDADALSKAAYLAEGPRIFQKLRSGTRIG